MILNTLFSSLSGLLALSGTEIGAEVYAWTAVFILPVNSALNPFLYTVPSLLHRKVSIPHDCYYCCNYRVGYLNCFRELDLFLKD